MGPVAVLVLALLTAVRPAEVDEAEALWQAGRRQEAIALLEAALQASPQDRELALRLVRAELVVRRYAAALALAEGLGDAARAERGRALFFLARYEEALQWLDAGQPAETLLVADALEALGSFEGPAGADAAVDRAAAALGAEHPQVLVLIARRHERHGRWKEAVLAYQAALAADPIERTALFRLGHALLGAGELEAGRAALEHHRELLPLLDRLDDARRSVELAPAHGPNHASLGDAERALGRIDEAEAAYRTALARTTGEQRVPVALRLARLLRDDRGSIDGAVGLLTDIAESPEALRDPRPSVRAGDYLMEAGRALEALQHYLRAEARAPDDPSVRERVEKARRAAGIGS